MSSTHVSCDSLYVVVSLSSFESSSLPGDLTSLMALRRSFEFSVFHLFTSYNGMATSKFIT